MENLRIYEFNSGRKHGQMNTNPVFYPEDMEFTERKEIMNKNKQEFISELGLSYKDIFINIQKGSENCDKYENGLCYTLTPDDIKEYDDLYDLDVYADIVKLTPETRNVAIAFPTADCAVVKALNVKTNEVVLAHCGGEYIDRYLPMQTIDALGGSEKDIRVYVSPFAYTLTYDDPANLVWANNDKVWKDCKYDIKKEDGTTALQIDIHRALRKQLLDRKIPVDNLFISPYLTTIGPTFYSNARGYSDPSAKGRFLSGIAIIDNKKDIKENPYIKRIK